MLFAAALMTLFAALAAEVRSQNGSDISAERQRWSGRRGGRERNESNQEARILVIAPRHAVKKWRFETASAESTGTVKFKFQSPPRPSHF